MTNPAVPGLPNDAQSQFTDLVKSSLPGQIINEEFWAARPASYLLAHVTPVAFVKTLTFGANNPTDAIGLKINGGLVSVPSGASATATALAWSNELKLADFAWKVIIDDSVPAAAVVTITGVLGQDPTLEVVQGGATTLDIGITTAAVLQPIVCFGEGVVRDGIGDGLNRSKMRRPSALTDQFVGVVIRTMGAQLPAGQVHAYDPTLDPANPVPGRAYDVERENATIAVEYFGADPAVTDSVYHIMVGTNAGQWTTTDGGVAKEVTFTVTSVADGDVGFSLGGLLPLTLTATANATADATSLFALLSANASYAALLGTATDNLDGTLDIIYAAGQDPAFVDASTGTSAVAEVVDVAFVAANAKLHDEYSWAHAPITASADLPARAPLRLSRS